jgi:large repetitive protein
MPSKLKFLGAKMTIQSIPMARASKNYPFNRMLTSMFPFVALAMPVAAHAQNAVNTATVLAPANVTDPTSGNNSATDTDTVLALIVATDDIASGVNGPAGGTAVANAFTADTLNGIAASPSNATLSVKAGTTVPTGLTFDTATGNVDVAAGTPAGTYVISYTICETLNPTNCKDATITVGVVVFEASPVIATNDSATAVNGATGNPTALNLFAGDTVNGAPATAANAILSIAPGFTLPSALTFDPATGVVGVRPGTPAGSYSFDYQLCETLNPTNCKTATASITVDAAPLVATNDTAAAINGASGATAVANAFTSDTVNGVAASPTNATLSLKAGTTVPAGLTFNPATGSVDVAAGTPAGSYVISYTICEALNPTCPSSEHLALMAV